MYMRMPSIPGDAKKCTGTLAHGSAMRDETRHETRTLIL